MLSAQPIPASDIPSTVADSPWIYQLLIPADSPLRWLREQMDFSFARTLVTQHYCLDNGRPGIAPELLCRLSLLQFLYNLSDREVIEACAYRLDFKFFLGLAIEAPAPCEASTLSRVRTRWGETTFKEFFAASVEQARVHGVLGTRRVVDSAKTLMNAAVLRASTLLQRLCVKLLDAVTALASPDDATVAPLRTEATALQEDTSWLLSEELKEQRYLRWGAYAHDLLAAALALLERAESGAEAPAALERVRQYSRLLAKHLGDVALEAQLTARAAAVAAAAADAAPSVAVPPVKLPEGRKDKLVSDVDPEARQAADRKRKVKAGYKTHVAMDSDSEIVTALIVTPMNGDDGPQLLPLLAEERRRGVPIAEVAADAAYADGAVRAALAEAAITTFIPEPRAKSSADGTYLSTDFRFDAAAGTLTCPAGQHVDQATEKGEQYLFYFRRAVCAACPLNTACLSKKELAAGVKHGRTVSVSRYRPLHEAARAARGTPEHTAAMHRRLAIEHKQSEMLNQRGLRHARYRGVSKTTIQAYLTAFATNLRRLAVLCLQGADTQTAQPIAA